MSATWQAACPACRSPLGDLGPTSEAQAGAPMAATCPGCNARYPLLDGVWRMLTDADARAYEPFLADYQTVRRGEGRGSDDPAYYRDLPATPPSDPLAWQWQMRARTWSFVARRCLPRFGPGLRVVDLGAGVGWLSNRLAALGHQPIAIDVNLDDRDGLGAARHFGGAWPVVQAQFDAVPLLDGQADLVIYNASFHYSADPVATLREGARLLRAGGAVVVVDTPIYRREESGRRMVAERHADFERRFGTRSDAIASIEFLTDDRVASLARTVGLRWERHHPWYGWRWAWRPWRARLRGAREPSRFAVLLGRPTGAPAGHAAVPGANRPV